MKFDDYVCQNQNVHFSAGLSLTKAGIPINQLSEQAEHALEMAKNHTYTDFNSKPQEKNSVCVYQQALSWFDDALSSNIKEWLMRNSSHNALMDRMRNDIEAGLIAPGLAADRVLMELLGE